MITLTMLLVFACDSTNIKPATVATRDDLTIEMCLLSAIASVYLGEVADAQQYMKHAHAIDPSNALAIDGLKLIRAHVTFPSDSVAAASLQPASEWYPGWLFSSALIILGFFAWCIVCASLTGWYQVRSRRWLIVAGIMLPLALIPPLNELVRHVRQERDRVGPPVVIARDTALRAGNGHDYASKINLPHCVECRKIGERGEWLQIEFASGLTGWVEKQHAIVATE